MIREIYTCTNPKLRNTQDGVTMLGAISLIRLALSKILLCITNRLVILCHKIDLQIIAMCAYFNKILLLQQNYLKQYSGVIYKLLFF